MSDFHVQLGQSVSFSKTVSEADIYLFAGITGDLAANHVNEEVMKKTSYGQRIAHGALLVGYMSNCSTRICEACHASAALAQETAVSLGYDRIRFLKAVFIGDTITVNYKIANIDLTKRRATSQIEVHNQAGDLVAIATHILKWVRT